MKSARRIMLLVALSVGTPWAMAQNQDAAPQPVQIQPPQNQRPNTPPPTPAVNAPIQPAFEPLAKKDKDGKVIRVQGVVDILALKVNPKIDDETKSKLRPVIANWMADVEQIAIDNLDFIEKIEPGDGTPSVMEKVNVDDHAQLQQMSQMMNQLISAGPLSAHLETKGALTREQSGLNQQISADYLQQCMNEIQSAEPTDPAIKGDAEKTRTWRINNLTRFLYALSCNDPLACYHRLMQDAAPKVDQIVGDMGLKGEAASKVQQAIPAVKSAKTRLEQQMAVRKLMNNLSFDQRSDFLKRSQDLNPVTDPLSLKWE